MTDVADKPEPRTNKTDWASSGGKCVGVIITPFLFVGIWWVFWVYLETGRQFFPQLDEKWLSPTYMQTLGLMFCVYIPFLTIINLLRRLTHRDED